MAAPIKFESSWEKEKYKEIYRNQREKILAEAKAEYDRKEKRKERARQQGEGTWMLPSVDSRIQNEQQELEKIVSDKKHKKKHKKDKKLKKSKKKKHHSKSSGQSDSSSEEEGAVWQVKSTDSSKPASGVETSSQIPRTLGPKLERDSWMTSSSTDNDIFAGFGVADRRRNVKAEARKAEADALEEARSKRELNPFWKNGGTGMPPELTDHNPSVPVSSMSSANDGGLSWWRKAYQRCSELAESEGRSMEDIAAERYGSLAELKSKLKQAETAEKTLRNSNKDCKNDVSSQSSRFRRPEESSGRYSSNDNEKDRQNSFRFRRPDDEDGDDERDSHRRHTGQRSEREPMRDHHAAPAWRKKDGSVDERDSHRRHIDQRSDHEPMRDHRAAPAWRKKDDCVDERDSHRRHIDQRSDREPMRDHRAAPAWRKKDLPSNSTNDINRQKKDLELSTSDSEHRESKIPIKTAMSSMKFQDGDEHISRHKRQSSDSSESTDSESSSEEENNRNKSAQHETVSVEVVTKAIIKPLSEQEMNQLGAKILKAELMGNEKLAQDLKNQLEAARRVNAEKRPIVKAVDKDEEEIVVLSRTDSRGVVRPVLDRKHPAEPERGRRKKQKVSTHGKKGERERYFDDDDSISLKTMVEREKLGTAEDQNHMFARLAGRGIDRTDDEYQMDDALLSKAAVKQSQSHIESRDRQLAIYEHKKMSASLDKCQFCFSNIPKHLIVAIGIKVCLILPQHRSMDEGHCLIVPMQHVVQSTVLDEDVWDEIKIFRKGLTRMFEANDEDCLFMETAMNLKRLPHMVIECVPVPKHIGDTAPIYFKKAIMECEAEWADNKKLVDLSKKDIRKSVPKGFPYFSVDFGLQNGYAHVIENEQSFPSYFGREVVGGMLDLEPTLWRKPHQERFDCQRKKVLKFAEMWKPYDWTQRLKQGGDRDDDNNEVVNEEADPSSMSSNDDMNPT